MAIFRLNKVLEATGQKNRINIQEMVQAGMLTEPISIGYNDVSRMVGWPDFEVQAVVAAQISGKSKDEIRALVKQLHAKRANHLNTVMAEMAGA